MSSNFELRKLSTEEDEVSARLNMIVKSAPRDMESSSPKLSETLPHFREKLSRFRVMRPLLK